MKGKLHIGTKAILATPMTHAEYQDYRGWPQLITDGTPEPGYLVEYLDGGAPNHDGHAGYISWSPADVFSRAYQPSGAMSFGHALVALKEGHRVARAGWNGKGMFLFLVNGSRFIVNREPLLSILGEGTQVDYHAHIDMRTADGTIVPWLGSQTDMLADDWMIVEGLEVDG